ncbi:MAG: ribonuclease III [Microbacteriaceae bacterium]
MALEVLIERLGVSVSEDLLRQALTHRSYSYEHRNQPNNERLEFLGDSVLGFVVTGHLFETFGDLDEGKLTKLKNAVVSAKALAKVGADLGLGEFMLLGRGEQQTGGQLKVNLLADTFEAILGAVYVELGIEKARELVLALVLGPLANPEILLESSDPKTTLQERAQSLGLPNPSYGVTHDGPDHDRTFFATVMVGELEATGSARTRKDAEAVAALDALSQLGTN